MDRSTFAILFASFYLLVFMMLLNMGYYRLSFTLFLGSPFIVIYMVVTVIRFGKYTGIELQEDEEWGYEDIDKDKLGIW